MKRTNNTDRPLPRGPAIARALSFVNLGIDKGEWHYTSVAPSLRLLAGAAGVSRSSMWKAIGILKTEKRLSVVEGGKIRIGAIDAAHVLPPGLERVWEKKRALLMADVLAGKFQRGDLLPCMAKLQIRYGSCYATMRKILASMVELGMLRPHGKSYTVAGATPRRFQSTIVVLSPKELFPLMRSSSQELIDTFENECAESGLHVRYISLDTQNGREAQAQLKSFERDDSVVGYCFNLWWLRNSIWLKRLQTRLLAIVASQNKPIAILDHVGEFLQDHKSPNGAMRVFTAAGRAAARSVAKHLLDLGHRHVAYISYFWHDQAWSSQRLTGVREMFTMAGYGDGVGYFTDNAVINDDGPFLSAFDVGERQFEEIFRPGSSEEVYSALLERYRRLKDVKLFQGVDPGLVAAPMRDFMALTRFRKAVMSTAAFAEVRQLLFDRVSLAMANLYMGPFFKKILKHREITAWICSNDQIALGALEFLKQEGLHSPRDISVVGFDNSIGALESNLTSYDFRITTIARRMLNYVLQPIDNASRERTTVVSVEGNLIARGSTGKAC